MSLPRFFIVLVALCMLCAPAARSDDDMPIQQLTTENFASTLKGSDHLVLIEFKARWCPYCKKEQPDIEKLRESHRATVEIYQVDVDDDPDIANDYDAHVLPTLIGFWHGSVVGRSEGALYGSDLTDWIKDMEGDIRAKHHKSVESDSPQPL